MWLASHRHIQCRFVFHRREINISYIWALEKFKQSINVVVTDRKIVLMNSLAIVFPKSKNLCCIGHINKNTVAKYKSTVTSEIWGNFLIDFEPMHLQLYGTRISINSSECCAEYASGKEAVVYIE